MLRRIVFWQKKDMQDGIRVFAVVAQLLSHIWLFGTPWTAARQIPLSSAIFRSLLEFMNIELVMLSIISSSSSCRPFSFCLQSFPALGFFPVSQLFSWGSQSIRASVSASGLPVNIQDWFPLGLTGLISLQTFVYNKEKKYVGKNTYQWTDVS